VADLGEGPGGPPPPPLFWVKKENITKGRKAGRAIKTKPSPSLSLQSGSATDLYELTICGKQIVNSFALRGWQ